MQRLNEASPNFETIFRETFKFDVLQRETTRSPYEQGKANYLGSRTPDMPRRTFTLTSPHHQYTSDAESLQPRWRIRSPVQRSSSALDMDHFASMRRRKVENSHPPLPYPRNCSLYSVSLVLPLLLLLLSLLLLLPLLLFLLFLFLFLNLIYEAQRRHKGKNKKINKDHIALPMNDRHA